MNTEDTQLDALVDAFAAEWLLLPRQGLAERIVADPLLVLGADGTMPVPRSAFLSAIAARAGAVEHAVDATTTLVARSTLPLGPRMLVATLGWSFDHDGGSTTLVSDFLLERRAEGLRCVAYLPRTNVLDHLG